MSHIKFISANTVISIQKKTLPNSVAPDINKLEGALYRVQTLNEYENCKDIFKLAAMYLIAIAKAHAFYDANKRTAFQVTSVFLLLNGYELKPSEKVTKLTVLAAMGEVGLEGATCALQVLSDYRDDLVDEIISKY